MKMSFFLHILPLGVISAGRPKYDFYIRSCSHNDTHQSFETRDLFKLST